MPKIDKQIAQEIINQYVKGKSVKELSDRYKIWTTSIGNIIRGKCWKKCSRPENIDFFMKEHLKQKGGLKFQEINPLTELQNDILVGSMLGDGSVTKIKTERTNSSFCKTQMANKKAYLDWHLQSFEFSRLTPVISTEHLKNENGQIIREIAEKRLSAYVFSTTRNPVFTELRKIWYPKDVKEVPENIQLNNRRIAIWYFDDGSNNIKHRVAVLCTNSFSSKDIDVLMPQLKLFNLYPKMEWQKSRVSGKKQPILKFSKDSYDCLLSLVKPYMLWDCFQYKINWRPAKKQWETSSPFSEQDIRTIIELRKTKTAKEISQLFNVHVNTIYCIVSGRTWGHLER